jgi:hypothetical protein
MSAEDTVDAALAGLDQGEIVTIPSLPDKAEWDAFDAARRAMSARLSSPVPGPPIQDQTSPISRSMTSFVRVVSPFTRIAWR